MVLHALVVIRPEEDRALVRDTRQLQSTVGACPPILPDGPELPFQPFRAGDPEAEVVQDAHGFLAARQHVQNTPASAETGTNTAAATEWQELQQTQCLQLNQWLKADLDTWANDLNDAVKAMTELTDRTEDGLGEKTAFKRAGNDCWARAFDLLFDIVRREGREGMESLFTEIGEAL